MNRTDINQQSLPKKKHRSPNSISYREISKYIRTYVRTRPKLSNVGWYGRLPSESTVK